MCLGCVAIEELEDKFSESKKPSIVNFSRMGNENSSCFYPASKVLGRHLDCRLEINCNLHRNLRQSAFVRADRDPAHRFGDCKFRIDHLEGIASPVGAGAV